jgi:hypothetical protein
MRRALMRTERDALAYSFEHKCASCRALLQPGWHADHIQPLADGGSNGLENIQPLCAPCHTLKTARENSARGRRGPLTGVVSRSDRTREIALTEKCTAAFDVWRARGEPFRVERYDLINGRCLDQLATERVSVIKTRNAKRAAPYNTTDLKHDLRCGFVVLR